MKKYGIEAIRKSMEREGYILLSKKYSSTKKLKFICPKGHKGSMLSCNWNGGKRCRICSFKKMGERSRVGFDKIRLAFESEGYRLFIDDVDKYVSNRQKLRFVCPKGHKHQISWTKWQQGQRCFYCSGKIKLDVNFIRKELEKEKYVLLSDKYLNSMTKFRYICPNGHEHQITWGHWQQGKRCPYCSSNGISKWEESVKKIFDKLNIDYISNDKTQLLNPSSGRFLELDLWFPQLNKAIECNGLYWHKDRQHIDLLKQQLCQQQGIDLLVITDEEWTKNKEKCKKKLISFVETEV